MNYLEYINNNSKRKKIYDIYQEILKLYNFNYIYLPMFEPASLYFRTSGVESDICNKELYEVRRYKDEFQDLVLRPEGTASCMREVIDKNLLIEHKEARFYYIGEMFRYNRPQKGRYRQHVQLGCEIFGNDNVYLDYEIIEIAIKLLKKLNIKYTLEVNSIGSYQDRKNYKEILSKYFKQKGIEQGKDPLKTLDKINASSKTPIIELCKESKDSFDKFQDFMNKNNINFKHNPYLVRGLDYYNDLVFEIKADGMSIIAGGRYNKLSKQINEKYNIPAVGFGAGVERLMLHSNFELDNKKIAIINLDEDEYSIKIANILRKDGITCSIYWGYTLKKALYFLSKQYRFIIFAGRNEKDDSKFILKDLKLSKQFLLNLEYSLKNII